MHDDGALSSAGRFERMERLLIRIEEKLDTKADLSVVEALHRRVDVAEDKEVARQAREDERERSQDAWRKLTIWAISLVTVAGVIFNAAIFVLRLLLPPSVVITP